MIRKVIIVPFVLFQLLLSYKGSAQPKFGKQAMEISLPALNGDTVKLSSLKGKVVLIDFWASWCGPCRYSNRELVKLYKKYSDKGFEIYGVSFDKGKKAWERAIKKDKITWIQVNDNEGNDSQIAEQWEVYQIPTSYVMDKDGTLIAMDLDAKQLERLLKERLN